MLYLRFTKDAQRDLQARRSVWVDPNMPDEEAELVVDGMNARYHAGLCGHELEAEELTEALNEVREKRHFYMDAETSSWAIFEGCPARINDTPEGDTFIPESVLHVNLSDSSRDAAY